MPNDNLHQCSFMRFEKAAQILTMLLKIFLYIPYKSKDYYIFYFLKYIYTGCRHIHIGKDAIFKICVVLNGLVTSFRFIRIHI